MSNSITVPGLAQRVSNAIDRFDAFTDQQYAVHGTAPDGGPYGNGTIWIANAPGGSEILVKSYLTLAESFDGPAANAVAAYDLANAILNGSAANAALSYSNAVLSYSNAVISRSNAVIATTQAGYALTNATAAAASASSANTALSGAQSANTSAWVAKVGADAANSGAQAAKTSAETANTQAWAAIPYIGNANSAAIAAYANASAAANSAAIAASNAVISSSNATAAAASAATAQSASNSANAVANTVASYTSQASVSAGYAQSNATIATTQAGYAASNAALAATANTNAWTALAQVVYPLANVANISTSTYTLLSTDHGKTLEFTHTNGCIVTLPTGLNVGFNCELYQVSNTAVSWTTANGVTVRQPDGHTKSRKQWASVAVRVRASNEFAVNGDTTS